MDQITQIIEALKTSLQSDIMRKVSFLAAIAASVAVGIGIYNWTQEPIYRPLDYRINDKNFASIIDTLEKANIKYKINDASGTVSVPAQAINQAKIRLSSAGIAKEDGFNYGFLEDNSKFGSNQFLDNARYIRALETDLSKTIRSIQGISGAKVHIAVPQSNVFVHENGKTTASIIINVVPGYEQDKEKIAAIIQLVAASVPNLDPKNIAITDQYGHYLSNMANKNYLLNQEQLNYQNNLQGYYEKRIQSLLVPILGANKASINVHTDIDFTKREETKEQYDPEKRSVRSEQTVNDSNSSSGGSGVPGALSNQPPAGGNNAQPSAPSGGQSHSEFTKNYEVSKSMRYSKAAAPQLKRISVAVVLDNEKTLDGKTNSVVSQPISAEKLKKITDLVKSSVGFREDRGDQVTVVNSSFTQPEAIKPAKTYLWDEPWFWDMLKKSVGILLGFIFLWMMYRKFSSHLKNGTKPRSDNKSVSITSDMIKMKQQQLDLLKDMVKNEPKKVTEIIKSWIRK